MATRITFENLYQTRALLLKAGETKKLLSMTANIGGGGVDTFLSLLDTPANFSGHKGKVAAVNTGETGIEFIDVNLLSPDVSGLQTDLDLAEGRIDNLEVDFGVLENDLAAALVRILNNENAITALQGFDTGSVTALQTQVTTHSGEITTLQGEMDLAEQDIASLESDVGALTAMDTNAFEALGISKGNRNLGSFAGNTIPDNASVKGAIQTLELALESIDTSGGGDANTTVIGTTEDHLGQFTGTIITDDITIREALQELETYSENLSNTYNETRVDAQQIFSILGVSDGDTHLGQFTGDLIADNVSTKVALQTIETAVELLQTSGSSAEATAMRRLTGTSLNAEHLGQFPGTLITDNSTIKTALTELETLAEKNQGDIENLDIEAMSTRTLSGTLEGARDLGTFTGSTIADNSDIKQALAQLEAAVEGTGGNGGTELVNLRTMTGTLTGDQNLGEFTGLIISNNNTVKGALQELETAIENGTGGGGGLGGDPIVIISDRNYTLESGKRYLFDASAAGGELNAILPTGSDGDSFLIGFVGGAFHNINLTYAGQRIAGYEATFVMDKPNMVLIFEYIGGTTGWKIINGVGEGGSGGSGGTEIPPFEVVSASFPVEFGKRYLGKMINGPISAQVPDAVPGDWFTMGFYERADATITLNQLGIQKIMGMGEPFVLDQDYMVLTFEYVDDDLGWKISDGIGEGSGGSEPSGVTEYRIKVFAAGSIDNFETLFIEKVDRRFTLPQSMTKSVSYAGVANSSGGAETITIKRNGVDVGLISFNNGVSVASYLFTQDVEFAVGDIITIQAAGTLTLQDLSLTIVGDL